MTNWIKLTSDRRILDSVKGYEILFLEELVQIKITTPFSLMEEDNIFVMSEIKLLLNKEDLCKDLQWKANGYKMFY